MTLICLDSGHGGTDPGALGNGLIEKVQNYYLTKAIKEVLVIAGYEVRLTKVWDDKMSSRKRAEVANKMQADIFISVHHNAFSKSSANGFEVLYYPTSELGKAMATSLCDKVCGKWPIRNRGPKLRRDLSVLTRTDMPAILIEAGFLTSDIDYTKTLHSKGRRARFYALIATSVKEVLNELV